MRERAIIRSAAHSLSVRALEAQDDMYEAMRAGDPAGEKLQEGVQRQMLSACRALLWTLGCDGVMVHPAIVAVTLKRLTKRALVFKREWQDGCGGAQLEEVAPAANALAWVLGRQPPCSDCGGSDAHMGQSCEEPDCVPMAD